MKMIDGVKDFKISNEMFNEAGLKQIPLNEKMKLIQCKNLKLYKLLNK
jgi:hypothetical protein